MQLLLVTRGCLLGTKRWYVHPSAVLACFLPLFMKYSSLHRPHRTSNFKTDVHMLRLPRSRLRSAKPWSRRLPRTKSHARNERAHLFSRPARTYLHAADATGIPNGSTDEVGHVHTGGAGWDGIRGTGMQETL